LQKKTKIEKDPSKYEQGLVRKALRHNGIIEESKKNRKISCATYISDIVFYLMEGNHVREGFQEVGRSC